MFTEKEIAYLRFQPLGRIATVSQDLQPDVTPVGFEFDGQYLYIGGINLRHTRKYKNIQAGNTRVAFVVDNLYSINPWRPAGIRIYGTAEIIQRGGRFGEGHYIRITPTTSWSWNIDEPTAPKQSRMHKTIHQPVP